MVDLIVSIIRVQELVNDYKAALYVVLKMTGLFRDLYSWSIRQQQFWEMKF